MPALVFEEEIDHRGADHHGKKRAHRDHEQHQAVHLGSEVRRLLRIQWQFGLHDQCAPCWRKFVRGARLSRRRKNKMTNSNAATVSTAPTRMTPKIEAL